MTNKHHIEVGLDKAIALLTAANNKLGTNFKIYTEADGCCIPAAHMILGKTSDEAKVSVFFEGHYTDPDWHVSVQCHRTNSYHSIRYCAPYHTLRVADILTGITSWRSLQRQRKHQPDATF